MIHKCRFEKNEVIPVSDGVFYTSKIKMLDRPWVHFSKLTFRVAFYSDPEGTQIVTPSAGIITPQMEAIDGQWHEPGGGDLEIDATLCGEEATYEIPTFPAPASRGRVTLTGIEGALYCRAHFVRS